MHPIVVRLRIVLVFTLVLFARSNVLVGRVLAAEPAPSARCVAAAYRQFDFWAGDWDVFDVGSSIRGQGRERPRGAMPGSVTGNLA